jgi:hypothetical protein
MLHQAFAPNYQEFRFVLTSKLEAAFAARGLCVGPEEFKSVLNALERAGFREELSMPEGYDYDEGDVVLEASKNLGGYRARLELRSKASEIDSAGCREWKVTVYQDIGRGGAAVSVECMQQQLESILSRLFTFGRCLAYQPTFVRFAKLRD